MSMLRAFIALEIPLEIQNSLTSVLKNFKQRISEIPVRWVPVQNIHLTLMFLGDVSTGNLQIVKDNLEIEAVNHAPFEISIGNSGAFPNSQRPRVIWVGVEAPEELSSLQSGIEHRMTRLGYPKEERAFSPHLTVGRVSRNISQTETRSISQVLQSTQVGFIGVARMEQVHLFRSDLNAAGAIYTKIHSSSLSRL